MSLYWNVFRAEVLRYYRVQWSHPGDSLSWFLYTFLVFIAAIAILNGISRDKPGWLSSWQHSTIARRVAFLQEVGANPALEARFQRRVRLLKWILFVGLGVLLISVMAALVAVGDLWSFVLSF